MWRYFKEETSYESRSEKSFCDERFETETLADTDLAEVTPVADRAEYPKETSAPNTASNPTGRPKASNRAQIRTMATAMFDLNMGLNRDAPQVPSTENIEYPRAASWANASLQEVLGDDKARQLLLVFLHSSLAEENLYFVESVGKMMKEKDPVKKKEYFEEFYQKYSPCVNISSAATQTIREGAQKADPDMQTAFGLAYKEVNGLLERDQFPRFKRSQVYLDYLEKLLPRSYAEKWAQSFEALLGNQIGRTYFRKFLKSIKAEENLRFWEAVIEFRQTKPKSSSMDAMAKNIQRQYLVEGTSNEVFLAFGIRQLIEKRIKEGDIDGTLFDEAIKHVEGVLKSDPYNRFIQSEDYRSLLHKLK